MEPSPIATLIERQRPALPLWIPVALGLGIGLYFALPGEPQGWMLAAIAAAMAMCAASLWYAGPLAAVVLWAVLLTGAGYERMAWRSHAVGAPVLERPVMANVEGRIAGLDRSGSGRPRVTLHDVVLHGVMPARTPERVRISLLPETDPELLRPGAYILGYARLSPPPSPSEPGDFDFRRYAWFKGLGAIGYARTPFVERDRTGGAGLSGAVFAARVALSRAVQAAIPGRNGGFAAAILTGDRAAVDGTAVGHLRASNLAHLLAISGLHMGLLTGVVFGTVRFLLAAVPMLALRYPVKKIAAVAGIGAGAVYLALSGANVATQRAFIMTSVVLVAVLLDRPAFTLRSVALAAVLVLMIRPESLTEAGFQMSFAATTALIATFEWLRGRAWWRETQTARWRFFRPVIGVATTSFVAGMATAPISAFHFNTMSQYGLFANVLAVPAMGLVVMPAAVLAGALALFGLGGPGFWVMGQGIEYILRVAEFFATREGAVRAIPAGPGISLILIALGGLFVVIWLGRWRLLGLIPMLAGAVLWCQASRPDILISDNGRLFGVATEAGRVLNSERGNRFVAEVWLGNDGDRAAQSEAYARPGMRRARGFAEMALPGGGSVVYFGSKGADAAAASACVPGTILLAPRWWERPEGACVFVGARELRRDGALAIWLREDGFEIDPARRGDGRRLWTRGEVRGAREMKPAAGRVQ